MNNQDQTPEAKKAYLLMTKATEESLPNLVESASLAGIASRGIAGINARAARDLQDVLTDALDAFHTNDHGIRSNIDQSAILEARNELYYGLIKSTRDRGHKAYDAHKEAGMLKKNSKGKAKNRNTYGKDARANISNKRKAIRNIFYAMTEPTLAPQVRAIMKPDADGKRSKWTDVTGVADEVIDQKLSASKNQVAIGIDLNTRDVWYLRDEVANYNTEEVDGGTITTIRWGTGDNAYDTTVELGTTMRESDLLTYLERHIADLGRRKSKAESDLEALREASIPAEHVLPSASNDG